MPFKTLRHIYKKGYVHILSYSSKIQQTTGTNKTLQKIFTKIFDISMKKMLTVMLSSNMKNEQQSTFHKKLQAKEGINSSFLCFYSKNLYKATGIFYGV